RIARSSRGRGMGFLLGVRSLRATASNVPRRRPRCKLCWRAMAPEGFRRKTTIDVRFRDLDLMGHVNNAVYFTYLEQARLDYFRDLYAAHPALEHPPGFIVASPRIEYRAPIFLDDRVDVWLRVSEIGRSSCKMA